MFWKRRLVDYDINDSVFDEDSSMPLEEHQCGQFSMAAVQSNMNMEDKSKVQVGNGALKVGIYDGFKGDSFQVSIECIVCFFLLPFLTLFLVLICMHACISNRKNVSCFNTGFMIAPRRWQLLQNI
ncbi:hypothetical protein MtrunA17_Chr4g0062981 [Medicago truncatula]|uniref:Transmembrane protein, putative n=1 Tax=Medicago truncatula TaxID=3880 RepID=G7JU74_MEDTR|nr:transmembrane protein, putative [Medicago truncatula]RHN63871.1 hypothetical protein MtrunA17_Chr4g0062981 [Medicago truncatula]